MTQETMNRFCEQLSTFREQEAWIIAEYKNHLNHPPQKPEQRAAWRARRNELTKRAQQWVREYTQFLMLHAV